MCETCERQAMGRRTFFSLAGAGMAVGAALLSAPAQAAGSATTAMTPDEALEKLKSGNERFVKAPEVCAAALATRRHDLAASQAPWATIVGCADSRVPPELLFGGLTLGELFVTRNAGNMVDTAAMGTIEYGAAVLGVPLIVVLGHERCGAVAAACDIVAKNAAFPGSIGPMVEAIVPAALAVKGNAGDFVDNAVRESAKRTALKIASNSQIVAERIKAGKVKIVSARYDLSAGTVTYLS